jgi:hypothetical protein
MRIKNQVDGEEVGSTSKAAMFTQIPHVQFWIVFSAEILQIKIGG